MHNGISPWSRAVWLATRSSKTLSTPATMRFSDTLSKLGADLRWFLEREGVDPERCIVSVGVPDERSRAAVVAAHRAQFEATGGIHGRDRVVDMVVSHGVRICVLKRVEPA